MPLGCVCVGTSRFRFNLRPFWCGHKGCLQKKYKHWTTQVVGEIVRGHPCPLALMLTLVDAAPMGVLKSFVGVVVEVLFKAKAMAKDADGKCLDDEFLVNDEPGSSL
jgi:hypothetical protein